MAKQIKGTVEALIERQSSNGKPYRVVRIDGEGYFDWEGRTEQANVSEGDGVRLVVRDGQYPRVQEVVHLGSGNGSQCRAAAKPASPSEKDLLIVRMSCLRSAAELLSNMDGTAKDKREHVVTLAAEMARWVTDANEQAA